MRPIAPYDDANRQPVPGHPKKSGRRSGRGARRGGATNCPAAQGAALGAGGGEGLIDEFEGVADVETGRGQMQ